MNKLVENFISYSDILTKLNNGIYEALLLTVSAPMCSPCQALHRGPLETLNSMINKELEPMNKKLLVVKADLSKDDLTELISSTNIKSPTSIPAFFLFQYKDNLLILREENVGYDVAHPTEWLNKFFNIILKKIKSI